MGVSVYDVNTYLIDDSTLANIAGKTMSFFPVVAPSSESAPFVVYYYQPMVPDVESYWMRCDYVRYSIFDSDAERLYSLGERLMELLTIGDLVSASGGITANNVRALSSYQVGSSITNPIEKEGWYRLNLDFKILNVDN